MQSDLHSKIANAMPEKRITMHARSTEGLKAGRKTQTRRIERDQSAFRDGPNGPEWWTGFMGWQPVDVTAPPLKSLRPRYQPDDILLVAEAWRAQRVNDRLKPSDLPVNSAIHYEADEPVPAWAGRYRHARFMCKWMCRFRLRVVGVRVERVQDISEADARAEGARSDCECNDCCDGEHAGSCKECAGWGDDPAHPGDCPHCQGTGECPKCFGEATCKAAFAELWDDTNGPGAWERNDWVFVYEWEYPDA